MTKTDSQCLESFAAWLKGLGTDVVQLSEALEAEASRPPPSSPNPEASTKKTEAVKILAGSLNYLFKSLDLIQDGIEDLGYVDDCFVLRVGAALALPCVSVRAEVLIRLAEDAETIKEFMGEDYSRLERYTEGTRELKVRGRTASEIAHHDDARISFLSEIKAWAAAYEPPVFSRDEKNLIRLRSFLATKLPS